MKRLLIAGVSLVTLTSATLAADMPVTEPAPVAVPYDWSGFYIGIHGGWAWGDADPDDDFLDDEFDADGFVVGGQIGYNWQMDWFLFGLEADGSFADLEDEIDDMEVEGDYLASARGRLGFVFDRFLVYGTGGAGFTNLNLDDGVDIDDDADYFGWVAGGGIEYAFTDNITFGVEYLHYDFGEEAFGDDDVEVDFAVDVIRGRLNFKFDSIFN